MNARLTLSESEYAFVIDILRAHLPEGVTVHVFGSRVSGKVKSWSDLDLVLEGTAPLPFSLIGALAEAFEESDLPWKVDLVDRKTVSDAFGKIIDQAKIALD